MAIVRSAGQSEMTKVQPDALTKGQEQRQAPGVAEGNDQDTLAAGKSEPGEMLLLGSGGRSEGK